MLSLAVGGVTKLIPYCSKPGQDLKLKKETLIAIGAGTDPIKMKRISTPRIGNAFAEEDRLIPGKP